MSATYDQYESEFSNAVRAIERTLTSFENSTKDVETIYTEGMQSVSSARTAVDQMKLEVKGFSSDKRGKCQQAIREHETRLTVMGRKLQSSRDRAQRQKLTSTGVKGKSIDAEQKLRSANEDLIESSDILVDTLKTAAETEEVGQGILVDLDSQQESLLRAQKNARVTQSYASQARSLLKRMNKRNCIQKSIIYFIILSLIVAIILVVYFLYLKK